MDKEITINGVKYIKADEQEQFEEQLLSKIAKVGDYVDYPFEYNNITDEFGNKENKTGWRVLKNDGVNVTLVSAGCPEKYYHEYGKSKESLLEMDKLCSKYLDAKLAMNTRALTKYDIDELLKCDSWDLETIGNDLVSLNCFYWLASASTTSNLYKWDPNNRRVDYSSDFSYGVRPVVVLKSKVKAVAKSKKGYVLN